MHVSSPRLVGPCRCRLSPVAWVLLCGAVVHHQVCSQCPVPSGLRGTWYRASDGAVVSLTTAGLRGHWLTVGSTPFEKFQCARSDGADTFVFGLEHEVDGMGGKVLGYFCWQLTKVTSTTYLLYQLTPVASGGSFDSERAVSTPTDEDVPPVTAVCLLRPDSQHPTILYKLSSDAADDVDVTSIGMAVQQCPPELFATFSYIKDDIGCTGKSSRLDFCLDRKTAHVNYTACDVSILFSDTGVLSCTASFTQDSDIYVLLVNHDSTVDDGSHFRFACMKLERDGETERAVVYPRDCAATEGTHTLTLTRTAIDDNEEDEDIVAIVAGAVVSIVFIIVVIVVIVLLCTKGILLKRQTKIKPASPPLPAAENGFKSHDKRDAGIAITIAETSSATSATGDNPIPAPEGESVVGGRLPPMALD